MESVIKSLDQSDLFASTQQILPQIIYTNPKNQNPIKPSIFDTILKPRCKKFKVASSLAKGYKNHVPRMCGRNLPIDKMAVSLMSLGISEDAEVEMVTRKSTLLPSIGQPINSQLSTERE